MSLVIDSFTMPPRNQPDRVHRNEVLKGKVERNQAPSFPLSRHLVPRSQGNTLQREPVPRLEDVRFKRHESQSFLQRTRASGTPTDPRCADVRYSQGPLSQGPSSQGAPKPLTPSRPLLSSRPFNTELRSGGVIRMERPRMRDKDPYRVHFPTLPRPEVAFGTEKMNITISVPNEPSLVALDQNIASVNTKERIAVNHKAVHSNSNDPMKLSIHANHDNDSSSNVSVEPIVRVDVESQTKLLSISQDLLDTKRFLAEREEELEVLRARVHEQECMMRELEKKAKAQDAFMLEFEADLVKLLKVKPQTQRSEPDSTIPNLFRLLAARSAPVATKSTTTTTATTANISGKEEEEGAQGSINSLFSRYGLKGSLVK